MESESQHRPDTGHRPTADKDQREGDAMAKDVKTATGGGARRFEFDGAGEYTVDRRTAELLDQLRDATDWDQSTLLGYLGAPAADPEASVEAQGRDDWAAWAAFLVGLAERVDTVWDKRRVVTEWASLLDAVGEGASVQEVVAAIEATMSEPGEDRLSPLGYVELGEVDQAAGLVRERLGKLQSAPTDPYRGAPRVHLSESRIDLLLDDAEDLLGKTVHRRMKAHLDECDVCREAVAFVQRTRPLPQR
jgi:hypothetical protein